jgi:hypothetical protein
MSGENYYLLSALPVLSDFGAPPPLRPAAFVAHVADAPGPRRMAEAIFLSDDLLQRDGFQAGDPAEVAPAVLAPEQVRGEGPLPGFLAPEADSDAAPERRMQVDAAWAAYFRYVRTVAEEGSFLDAWLRTEVGLRNAVAAARAKALGLDVESYLVAPELGGDGDALAGVVAEWAAAPDPLAAQRVLDLWRWAWLTENERWFSFSDDELAAYAAKLLLLERWKRIADAGH